MMDVNGFFSVMRRIFWFAIIIMFLAGMKMIVNDIRDIRRHLVGFSEEELKGEQLEALNIDILKDGK